MFDLTHPDALLRIMLLGLPVAALVTLMILLKIKAAPNPPKPAKMLEGMTKPSPPSRRDGIEAQPVIDDMAKLASRLATAQRGSDKALLAPLFLEIARAHRDGGRHAEFLAALRSAAGLGAQHGPASAHAEARLELAEVAFKAGDLTSACEQWQLARSAYNDSGQTEAHALIEQRMRDHGCPTDWVLTDF